MLKLDNNLLEELGLGGLPEDQKRQMLQHIYETLELRVGTQLANQMTDKQLEEFEKFIDAGGDTNQAQALQWLETNLPNYKQVVQQTFDALKVEVRGMAPQLLAAAQQAQGPQEAQIVAQPGTNGMPMQQPSSTPVEPVQAPAMSSSTPQAQAYGQSFQTSQPSYAADTSVQQTMPTSTPSATPFEPVQPLVNDATPQPWQSQTSPSPAPQPPVMTPPAFGQPTATPVPEPVAQPQPVPTAMPMDPFAAPQVPQPGTQAAAPVAPSFGQQTPSTAMPPVVPAWDQPQSPVPEVPQAGAPSWQQPQTPSVAPPSWQPQPPAGVDQQPPQSV